MVLVFFAKNSFYCKRVNTEMVEATIMCDVHDRIITKLIVILIVSDTVVPIGWYAVCMHAQFSVNIAYYQ